MSEFVPDGVDDPRPQSPGADKFQTLGLWALRRLSTICGSCFWVKSQTIPRIRNANCNWEKNGEECHEDSRAARRASTVSTGANHRFSIFGWLANSSLLWERGRVIIPLSCALDLVELWFRAAWVNSWEGDESIKIFS